MVLKNYYLIIIKSLFKHLLVKSANFLIQYLHTEVDFIIQGYCTVKIQNNLMGIFWRLPGDELVKKFVTNHLMWRVLVVTHLIFVY